MSQGPASPVQAEYFDGQRPKSEAVTLSLRDGRLWMRGLEGEREILLSDVHWPERQRHGARVAHLATGGALHCKDAAAWDALARAAGQGDGWVVRVQQSWRATLAACVALVALCAAAFLWGVPLAAQGVVAALPESVDRLVGDTAWKSMQNQFFKPTALSDARQAELRRAFANTAARARLSQALPDMRLEFRASTVGPNAFALPGGTIVLTDEMVELAKGDDNLLMGVLGHEMGHVLHRHSMRMVVQASLIGAATGLAFGDFSSTLAAAPAILGQLAYSRDFEREADAEALRVLRANGLGGKTMVVFFERLQAWQRDHGHGGVPALLSSHPVDDERIAFFSQDR